MLSRSRISGLLKSIADLAECIGRRRVAERASEVQISEVLMRVLIFEWDGYGYSDIIDAFKAMGYELKIHKFVKDIKRHDPEFERLATRLVEEFHPDYMFSFNYFPALAYVGKETGTRYVAWAYDNPLVLLYSYTIIFPTNYIFVFDHELYSEFHNNGINTIYYMPLASNPKRLNSYRDRDYFKITPWFNKASIAFVGSLYTEEHQFYNRMTNLTQYTRGYLEGIMAAQKNVLGYNFIREVLSPEIIADMYQNLPMEVSPDGVETLEYLYAQYVINRRITGMERIEILNKIGEKYPYDLYTKDPKYTAHNCINHGPVESYHGAPHVFHEAKINLNITLRSITTGVPLRVYEVLGSEGFLISNYQADFDDVYVADEDYVYYESIDDLMEKIDYYLRHDKRRKEIAHNGYLRTLENHTYEHRIQEIEQVLKTPSATN